MKQLHVDNATNRVILVSSVVRRSRCLGPGHVTVIEYVGPFISGLESESCINLVCNTDTLTFEAFVNPANETRLTAWHLAYVDFYKQLDAINKDYTEPLTAEQSTARAVRTSAVREAVVKTLGLK